MMIDKVGGIGPGYEPKKTGSTPRKEELQRGSDNVVISKEATRAAEVARTAKLAISSQDSDRAEHLRNIKERVQKGEYDNPGDEMVSGVADRLAEVFLSSSRNPQN